MKGVDLVEITTKDGLIHQGIYAEPSSSTKACAFIKASVDKPADRGRQLNTAILFVHGLTSAFYHQLPLQTALMEACREKGYGYAAFNNRGHDFVTSGYRLDSENPRGKSHVTIGSGVEEFTKSILDIDAAISFLRKQGYSSIILIGHSTGANKACYYAGTQNDKSVKGVVLAAPVSDRLIPTFNYFPFKRIFLKLLIGLGFANTLFTNLNYFPITPRRGLSLIEPHSDEDVFDYGEKKPRMQIFSAIKIPLLVLLGEHDEYVDRPITAIKKVFDAHVTSGHYKSIIMRDAIHGFDEKEKEFSRNIIDWIATI